MTPSSRIRSIVIDPPAEAWCDLVVNSANARSGEMLFGRSMREWCLFSRNEISEEFGGVEYVIGTGHQAGFWHCGILAKFCAADAFALAMGEKNGSEYGGRENGDAGVLELVVDQDVNDPFRVRAPMLKKKLDVVGVRLAGINSINNYGQVPVEMRPPIIVDNKLSGFIKGKIKPNSAVIGLHAIAKALREAVEAENGAEQAAQANYLLRRQMVGVADVARKITSGSALTGLTIWQHILQLMREDPKICALCYNNAVMKFPDSGMTLLSIDNNNIELPLWKYDKETGKRQRVFHHDLKNDNTMLRPRALLMTGVVRLVLVDLFIHGMGGKNYDRVTERWFGDWLGVRLAPLALVSADVYLDFGMEMVDEAAVSRARWQLHHLQYNLDRVVAGGEQITAQKRTLLEHINDLPRRSAQRYEAYRKLQSLNQALRRRHGEILVEAQILIDKRDQAVADRAVIGDRTWAFPLHEPETLQSLRKEITRLFSGVQAGTVCCCGSIG